jgi:hypothetical protein
MVKYDGLAIGIFGMQIFNLATLALSIFYA